MDKDIAAPFIPEQSEGGQVETSETMTAPDEETARKWFDLVCLRLQDVNHWNKWCGFLSSDFQLTDANGQLVTTTAHVGNYIRINIPGPGSRAGNGYDWVRIEQAAHKELSDWQELFLIQARPSTPPSRQEAGIAHFLDSKATSSFVVKRENRRVTAAVYGRNEVPNAAAQDTLDKLRNAVVGSSGVIGVSRLQWKALVRGLFDFTRESVPVYNTK